MGARVLSRARGGPHMRSKLPFSLALALTLLFIAAGALALTLINPFAERVMEMEYEHGSFSDWTLEEKLTLVEAMEEFGIDTSGIPDVSRLPEAQASARLGEAIDTLYAGEIGSLHYNILEKAKGLFDAWTLEDKAWYGELLVKYGQAMRPNDCLYALPSENVMPMEDAYSLACLRLCAAFGIDCAELSKYCVYPFYFSYCAAPDTYYWKFHWRNADQEMMYSALIPVNADERGVELWRRPTDAEMTAGADETTARALKMQAERERLEKEKGSMITWTFEEQAAAEEGYGVPRADEITREQAVEIAKAAIIRQAGLDGGALDGLYAYQYFVVSASGGRYYAVSFFRDAAATDLTPYAADIDAGTGEALAVYIGHNG